MRMIATLAVLSALAFGGCFHHTQQVTMTPQVLPPLK
jgi:hypothetical protein